MRLARNLRSRLPTCRPGQPGARPRLGQLADPRPGLQEFGRVLEEQGTPVEGVRALFVMNHENGDSTVLDTRGLMTRAGCTWTSARTVSST